MEEKKVFEDPEITTYDRQELDLETAVTASNSVFDSDRRLKENFRAIDPGGILDWLVARVARGRTKITC